MGESDNLRLRFEFSLQWAPYNESDTAQITSDLQMTLGHFLTVGDHDIASLGSYGMSVSNFSQPILSGATPQPTKLVDNVTTQETGGTEDGRSVS